ncbi:MAG TPA: M48 family metalloprotease [Syntrophales bacterium]|nr:M48 family metalloprotease [Syntrophales bacterium]
MNHFDTFKRKTAVIVLALLFSFLFQAMGSAYASFTIDDEKKLGKEFYDKLEKSGVLIHDERTDAYITALGNKLLAQGEKPLFVFHFSVIRSSAINAFATPGGYIYVNRGLVTMVETESELASVLAHEIAHIKQRHVASIIEKSQKLGIATLAAVLAGAFLGGGDLGPAVASFSLATASTLSLKFSREHEEEADRLGMSYLVGAGYDGKAMMDFMRLMRRYEYYSSGIPSYFLTHPGTEERITYIDALLHTTYAPGGSQTIIGNLKRVQTVLMFDEKNLDSSLHYFQNDLQKNPNDVDSLYGLAVTEDKRGKTEESLQYFSKALSLAPDDPDICRDLGVLYFKLGRPAEAVIYLKKALAVKEDDPNTLLYLGRSYDLQGDYASALDLYKRIEKKNITDPDIYYSIAMAYGKTNDQGLSHYYFGVYFKKKRNMPSSVYHFKEALKYLPPDSEKAREIEKELKTTKPAEKSYIRR